MKVVSINKLTVTLVYPKLFQNGLTVRTVAVAAGVGMEINIAALFTSADVVAKLSCFTVHDGEGGL